MRQTLILLLLLLTSHVIMRLLDTPFGSVPVIPGQLGICAHQEENGGLAGFSCKHPTRERLHTDAQNALGLRLCWWTASADALQRRIDGVGAGTARELVRLRNRGVRPRQDAIRGIARVSDGTAMAVAHAVDEHCGPLRIRHKAR